MAISIGYFKYLCLAKMRGGNQVRRLGSPEFGLLRNPFIAFSSSVMAAFSLPELHLGVAVQMFVSVPLPVL